MKSILPKRFGIIQKVIIVIAVIMMSVVWPLGAFPVSHVSTCEWDGVRMSGASNENGFVRQEFSPNFEELQAISVYVVNDPDSIDTMKAVLRVYNHYGVCLSETFFQVADYELPGYIKIPVDLELTPGYIYYYTIAGVDGDLIVAYSGDDAKTAENGAFFYKEIPSGGTSIVTEYEYERPMGYKRILMCDGLIAAVSFALIGLVGVAKKHVFHRCDEGKAFHLWKRSEKIVQYSVVCVSVISVIIAFVGIVINRLFTDDVINIIVLFLGVVIAAVYVSYSALTCKSELEPLAEGEACVKEKAIRIIRALLFAVVIIMCCMHQNGYTNYEKGLYIRRILTFFGLFMVSFGKKKWIWNIPNLIWSVLAFVIGKYYISIHSDHIEHINTATNDAWLIWVMGLIIVQIIYRIVSGEWKRIKSISLPYLALVIIFWISCIVFANGRQWPAVLCTAFLVWIFLYVTTDDKEKKLEDICNGVIFAFIGGIVFCLWRRPYQYYMFTRYGGIMFTATATATYYLIPTAAALVKVIKAIKEQDRRNLILSCGLFGIVAAYMSFTASRTGIISMAVMVLFAFIFSVWKNKKEKWKAYLKGLGVMGVSVLLCFVMAFSATRMVPAMAGNPFYFWFEEPYAFISKDTPWTGGANNADKFIDIQMTLEKLFGRLFAVNDETSESASAEYELGPLLASSVDTLPTDVEDTADLYSNGRLDIFKAYLSNFNVSGHDTMSATDAYGEPLVHAHNSYIQVAYDFGVPVGIVFLVFCLFAFIRGVRRAFMNGDKSDYEYFPLLVIVAFGVASMFEWIYHLANPLGVVFLVMIAPLVIKEQSRDK